MKATVTPFKGCLYFKGPEEWRTCLTADEKLVGELEEEGMEGTEVDLEEGARSSTHLPL